MKITLVIGLPACGKSHYARTISYDATIIDDPEDLDYLPKQARHLIISDPMFVDEYILNKCIEILSQKYNNPNIDLIYFKNDPNQCLANAKLREDKIVYSLINFLSTIYNPPQDSLDVWKGN